ncbi:MAG TPA: hypothetical protein VK967_08075 [Methylotenera sp.]|nr:hypothetical protein [Methylotenera sp.]
MNNSKRNLRYVMFALMIVFTSSAVRANQEVIPYDQSASDFEIVKGDFNKKYFLSGMNIKKALWIDNVYLLATIRETTADNLLVINKIVIINTDNGEVQDFGYSGHIKCLADGNIVIGLDKAVDEQTGFKIVSGKVGGELQTTLTPDPKLMRLNEYDCVYEKVTPRKKTLTGFKQVFRLKIKHGILESDDDFEDGVRTSKLSFINSSQDNFLIPTNVGESKFAVVYVPYEDAYMIAPYLRYDNDRIPWWKTYPRALFMRLLSPDGSIKRIPLPKAIEDKIKDKHYFSYRGVSYTKLGLLWSLTPRVGKSFKSPINYLQSGNNLIEINDDISIPSPNGCKLIGPSTWSYSSSVNKNTNDYYVIDICDEKKL